MKYSVVDLRKILEKELKNEIKKMSDFNLDYEETLKQTLDMIYDLSIIKVPYLSDRELIILRKRFGIYNNGKVLTLQAIANDFEELYSRERVNQIFKVSIRKIIKYVINQSLNKKNSLDKLLQKRIEKLQFSPDTSKTLSKEGIETLEELISLTEKELFLKLNSQRRFTEVILFIKNLGLNLKNESQLIDSSNYQMLTQEELLNTKILNLNLKNTIHTFLYKNGVKTVRDLLYLSKLELLRFQDYSQYKFTELHNFINSIGLHFKFEELIDSSNCQTLTEEELLNTRLDKLNIDFFINQLICNNIITLKDLVSLTERELLNIRNIGKIKVQKLKYFINGLGLDFAPLIDENNYLEYTKEELLATKIIKLNLSIETIDFLHSQEILFVQDLVSLNEKTLWILSSSKKNIYKEVKFFINSIGLDFNNEEDILTEEEQKNSLLENVSPLIIQRYNQICEEEKQKKFL